MSAPIEVGACYRDPSDGAMRRVIAMAGRGLDADTVPSSGQCVRWDVTTFASVFSERVPDPTPAVIDDEPAHDEAARQERVDATARALFVKGHSYVDAYLGADALEAARERYIASRKGTVKP